MNKTSTPRQILLPASIALAFIVSVNCSNARTTSATENAKARASNATESANATTNATSNPTSDASATTSATTQEAPDIGVSANFAARQVRRGGIVRGTVTLDIPGGFHVSANRPLGKYAVPTVLKIEAPAGVRVSPVTYPVSKVRSFKFSNERLAVYEGRAPMRFTVTVPASYKGDRVELRGNIRFQSCNDEVCFRPTTKEFTMAVDVK